jgi:formylglycine-generating enzyme required for sulfatase activity
MKMINSMAMMVLLATVSASQAAGPIERGFKNADRWLDKKLMEYNGSSFTESFTGMEFVSVPGGCFQMGDSDGYKYEEPKHKVCVDGFSMGKYEVTQGEWEEVMGDNPSYFQKGSRYPVERVSWNDVQNFIAKLNKQTGKQYRLPTEAEWEYAARSGGQQEKWAGINEESRLKEYAWYNDNSGKTTHEVGTRSPNSLGLYDMSGNVWEWVNDWYGENYYQSSPETNPKGPSSGSNRVDRGGCWDNAPIHVRAANRFNLSPDLADDFLGFRLVFPSSASGK